MDREVSSRKDYGGSLPVENVQELASHVLDDIPDRYIRPEMELEKVSINETLHIPIINMAEFSSDHYDQVINELEKLHDACKHWGFFQLINHGENEAIEKMKVDIEEFFKLPLEEKIVYGQLANNIEGYGQAFVVSEDQKLDWGDMLFLVPLPLSQRNTRFWPNTPASFRSTLDNYSVKLHGLAIKLIKLMAINLGIEPQKLTAMFEDDGRQGIRMNYYPPCLNANRVIGLAPHSDAVGLTLLVQVNDVPGLQIKKGGKWIPIQPIPEAIIVNIGDIMEILSNGEYSSIEHRAVVNFENERLSIAAFHSPNIRTKIGPLSDLVKENHEAKYKALDHEEYMRLVISSKLDGKSLLDHIKIKH